MTIGKLRQEYKDIINKKYDEYPDFISALDLFINDNKDDLRTGVISVITQAEKKKNELLAEEKRVQGMMEFEHKYSEYEYICGIDEVGRGPLAGPVVTAAVILPKDFIILYLNDSKQVPEKKRDELYDIIMDKAIAVGIGSSSEKVIDEIGIKNANYTAMKEAISKLSVKPDMLLVDAETIPDTDIPQEAIIKGDAKSVSIAAASIIAKVTRDRIMHEYDSLYPEYGFKSNVGYGSASHIAALKKYGPCDLHRRSFIKNFV